MNLHPLRHWIPRPATESPKEQRLKDIGKVLLHMVPEGLKRVPLAIDKTAAQAMLNKIVQRVEREKAGLVDPTEEQRKRLLTNHLKEFDQYLRNKGVSQRQYTESLAKLHRLVANRKWLRISDITASGVLEFLGQLRNDGLSAQTYNNYLVVIKQFTRWLVRDRRTPNDPLVHLSRINVRTDRRHTTAVPFPRKSSLVWSLPLAVARESKAFRAPIAP